MLEVMRSGAQTGPDRAAIIVAVEHNIRYTGYVPNGGWTEDYPQAPGIIPHYPNLTETDDDNPAIRTMLNVAESDGTLIIAGRAGAVSHGTDITVQACQRAQRPHLVVTDVHQTEEIIDWLLANGIHDLNVAGPRESESPGIQGRAVGVLEAVVKQMIVHNLVKLQ